VKIYLAARYSAREEMQTLARVLVSVGHTITSRWHNDEKETGVPGHRWDGQDRERAALLAEEDIADIKAADTLILFTPPGRRGGCNVEFGIAEALGKLLYVVGPRQNVFHSLALQVDSQWDLVNVLRIDPIAEVCASVYAAAKEAGR
jgi:nucleoside 2-deoxyribosyltransferase